MLSPISWNDELGCVHLLDQTKLPEVEQWMDLTGVAVVAEAIRCLAVRGAPAIGIAAALGCALAAYVEDSEDPAVLAAAVLAAAEELGGTRPTAVNLFWALEKMKARLETLQASQAGVKELRAGLLAEAQKIREEDIASCRAIGRFGAPLMPDEGGVITHCNAGALATGAYGTALGVIRAAVEAGKNIQVFADETRPLLQGARLTVWELMRDDIDVTLICDNMAGYVMRLGHIQACVVGADRITANGDAANKIGTYSLAVLAKRHGIPFYVAAPWSTVDMSLSDGDAIPIEQRDAKEITNPRGAIFAPKGTKVFNPAFDVTPASLISAIITDRGLVEGPDMIQGLLALSEA